MHGIKDKVVVITGAHHGSSGEPISVSSGNLLDEREAHINVPSE